MPFKSDEAEFRITFCSEQNLLNSLHLNPFAVNGTRESRALFKGRRQEYCVFNEQVRFEPLIGRVLVERIYRADDESRERTIKRE